MRASPTAMVGAGVALLLALTLPAAAQAGGGNEIASATMVTYGQLQTGNTATGQNCGGQSANDARGWCGWWGLPVAAGDVVRIDWEAPRAHFLDVFSTSTTDYTATTDDPVASSEIHDPDKAQLKVTAATAGTMPLRVAAYEYDGNQDAGPYNFTAYVRHGLIVSLPRYSPLPTQGTVTVGVVTPEGAPITDAGLAVAFQVKRLDGSSYRKIGQATVTNGVASIPYDASQFFGSKVRMRARATGPNYLTKNSNTRSARVR